jgi:hypothetical protein
MKHKELIVVVTISFLIAIASLFQTLVYVFKTPAGFIYPLVHNYQQDFYWYISLMHQGMGGSFLLTSQYSPETFAPQLVNTFFPLFGFIARIFHISLPLMYTILRLVGGAGLLTAGWILLKELKLHIWQRVVTYFLMIIGAPFWYLENGKFHQIGEFWTGFDPILRITWLPHHTISNTLSILAMIMFNRGLRETKKVGYQLYLYYIYAGLAASMSIWLNPASVFLLTSILLISIVYTLLRLNVNRIVGLIIYFVLMVIPIILLWRVQLSVFPWTAFRDWESYVQYPVSVYNYLKMLGVIGVIGIIGGIIVINKRNLLWYMMLGWFLLPFIGLLILIKYLPISNGRFLQTVGYIPASGLATITIWEFSKIFKRNQNLFIQLFISITLLINIPSFIASIERQLKYVDDNMNHSQVMVKNDTWEAISYLSMKKGGIIIAPFDISTMIPAFSGFKTLVGHPTFTYRLNEKSSDLNSFYWSNNQILMESIIKKYNVTDIWVPEWMTSKNILTNLEFKKIYGNLTVELYEK